MSDAERTTIRTSDYEKIANLPRLYRHRRSGRYYGVKKVNGNRYERSLRTCDRKIAERRLRDWVRGLTTLDRAAEKTTLRALLQKFVVVRQGKAAKTRATDRAIIKQLQRSWPGGLDVEVRNIRPSHFDECLALHEKRLKNTTYNRYAGLLKELFALAVRDRMIAKSPFDDVRCAEFSRSAWPHLLRVCSRSKPSLFRVGSGQDGSRVGPAPDSRSAIRFR